MSCSGDGHAGGTAAGPQQQVCECRAAVRCRQGWRSVALVYCVGRARVVANGPREMIAWRVAWGQGVWCVKTASTEQWWKRVKEWKRRSFGSQ